MVTMTVQVGQDEEYFQEDSDLVHCKHGTYIGYPGGPDYMCGWCEDGISDEDWRASQEWERKAILRKAFWRRHFDYFVVNTEPNNVTESRKELFFRLVAWSTQLKYR